MSYCNRNWQGIRARDVAVQITRVLWSPTIYWRFKDYSDINKANCHLANVVIMIFDIPAERGHGYSVEAWINKLA